MTQLRETTKRKILLALEKSHFTSSSYSVEYSDDTTTFLTITFLPNKGFTFVAAESYTGITSAEAPGQHKLTSETFKHVSLDDCLKAIAPWTARIIEDYRAHNPIIDEFEALRKSLGEQIEKHITDESAHFSAEEASSIRFKLDELSAKLSEVSEKTTEQEKQLRDAQQELKALKQDLDVFPKGVWYRMAGSKVLNIIKKAAFSKEGRDFALEAAKKFLLEGPK
jgi:hypothetical protein